MNVMSSQASRAAVFDGPGKPLQIQSLPLRPPGPGEVLVRVRCCTICGSDLHTWQGHRSTPTPTVLGHEILGEVEMIGAGEPISGRAGRPVNIGDRITWSIAASCGACFFCRHELPQKCEGLFKYGHEAIREDHALSGGLAEHCLLAPGTAIVAIPPELPDTVACPANCATATVAAAMRLAGLRGDATSGGQTILIQGLGALGLTAGAMARSLGAEHVIACDVLDDRLAMSRSFGVTHPVSIRGGTEELNSLCRELTGGRGIDAAIELSGAAAAVETALPLLRIGGRYVLVGSVFPGPDVRISPEMVVRRMLTIRGLHNYGPDDLYIAVRFLADHHRQYPFDKFVDGTWPLDQAEAAFQHAITHRPLRVAIASEAIEN